MSRSLASFLTLLLTTWLASTSWTASPAYGELEANRRSERAKSAQELLSRFEKLANLIQSPRPSESAWVQAEQQEIRRLSDPEASTARLVHLLQTPEFQQQNVYTHVQEVRNALRCVIDSPPTVQREVFCWAVAGFLLNDRSIFYDGLLVLLRAKRVPEDMPTRTRSASFEGISFLYSLEAERIQRYIVLPYLRGDIK